MQHPALTESEFTVESSEEEIDDHQELMLKYLTGEQKSEVILYEIKAPTSQESITTPDLQPMLYIEVYDRVAVEVYPISEYLQIQWYIPSSIAIDDVTELPDRNRQYMAFMHEILHPIIETYGDEESDLEVVQLAPKKKIIRGAIDKRLNISPYQGFLVPYECQLISVAFIPKPNTNVKAKALCHIYGGAIEEVIIRGKAADISYAFDTEYIDFGRLVSKNTVALSGKILM